MRRKVCLIDGSGYIFRAFYAIPPMTRPSDQTPINAVYGFTSMLMQFFKENKCDCMSVVFDAARKNFRNDIYKEYKANRAETPPELIPQFPLIRQAVKAFNVVSVEQEGYEADDLIASYARHAVENDMDVMVVSADKDLMQLMGDHVTVYDPMKKKVMTQEDVKAKFGVTSDKIVDIQSLLGDSSDNVPGVKGIGVKTAAELINHFGSLDALLARTSEISQERRRQMIEEGRDMALLSRRLVTLDDNVPLAVPLSEFCVREPVLEDVQAFLNENGFKSLLARTEGFIHKRSEAVQVSKQAHITKKYELVQDTKSLIHWCDKIKKAGLVAIDTETNSLSALDAELAGISLCVREGEACYIPLRHTAATSADQKEPVDLFNFLQEKPKVPQVLLGDVKTHLIPLLTDPKITKVGHNIKYDLQVFKTAFGEDLVIAPIDDTMVMAYDLYGSSIGLSMDELADRFFKYETVKYEDVCGKGKNACVFKDVPLDKALDYAAEDADITLRFYHYLLPKLSENKVLDVYRDIDLPLVSVLVDMERRGILVDEKRLKELSQQFEIEMAGLEKEIYHLAGTEFNINAPAQLGTILFDKMKLEGGKKNTKSQTWSTDVDVLESLAGQGIPLAQKVLDYRQFAKLKSTYTDALIKLADPNGRVHTTFMQTGTSTGRLSSNNPNIQNIPIKSEMGRSIRSAFVAKPGHVLLSADYSQIELRLIADVANVKGLKDAFVKGLDIHAATASQVFNVPMEGMDPMVRRNAKAINFGIIYGMSAFGLAQQLGIPRHEAKAYIDAYFAKFPEIKTYMDRTIQFASEHGYVVTPFGRKCFIQGFESSATKGFASRAAINAPMQGGAADIIKMAMNKMDGALRAAGLHAQMLLQVHDELVFEVPEQEADQTLKLVKEVMDNVVQLTVPITAEIGYGANWKDAH